MGFIENVPDLWVRAIPVPGRGAHKYTRGHTVILGGNRLTGAARLASEAAMRVGAGMCTIVADYEVGHIYQSCAPHILYEPLESLDSFSRHYQDDRRRAILVGPGAGREDAKALRGAVTDLLASRKAAVLDADALNVFEGHARDLFEALHENVVLTPHEGEFQRLFGDMLGNRMDMALEAAQKSRAVMVLKGAETVIAHPDGRVVVNTHATPWLATAGTGDVLAGMVVGLMAQGMDAFDAACAAVWIHGEAGLRIGPGLVAPDLIAGIPPVIRDFMG
jgi:NAD(P)H-hydrate epimerase